MATTKKPSAKKPATKKPASKKPATKATAAKATRVKATHRTAAVRSFRKSQEELPFKSLRITRQTFYWIVLVSFIIFAQLWIINLQIEVATLLDAQQAQLQEF